MDLAEKLQRIPPAVVPSPLPGFEHVRGFGIFGVPFDSGHVLALRVFPQNDFAPYRTVWHRTPAGDWSIYVDGPRADIACPRYYGAAASHIGYARIELTWTGPMELSIDMDSPRLEWRVAMAVTPLVRIMNAISTAIPERLWRTRLLLRLFERLGGRLFDLGEIALSGSMPDGQFGILMPRRMFPVITASARLDGLDLGQPTRAPANPRIGDVPLPARAVFAVGGAYFRILDEEEHERTLSELRAAHGKD